MRNDKHLAIKLRKKGLSYAKISKELDIPKSTLSDWFCKIGWSVDIKKELIRKANYVAKHRLVLLNKKRQAMWEQWREKARQQARDEFLQFILNPLFISGIMLYWGEGDSKLENSIVRISNTSPEMIRLFALFLQKICLIPKEKLRMSLILYPDLKEKKCKQFWSFASGVSENQFTKTQFIQGRHPTKRLTNGIGIIYVSSRELKEKIFVWIGLFYKQFASMRV